MKFLWLTIPLLLVGISTHAAEMHDHSTSKYAGQENRAIKSLSPADIEELRRGGGWGLAKAAELNGVPGPVHLLELKQQIPLNDQQVAKLTELYNMMNAAARRQGEILIALESGLESHFRAGTVTDQILKDYLHQIGQARTELRYIHLATHLKTPDILSKEQIARYNALRGYTNDDPCANIPEGHNAEMWRRHNGCD